MRTALWLLALAALVLSSACDRRCDGECCKDAKAADSSTVCAVWYEHGPLPAPATCGATVEAVKATQYCSGFSNVCSGRIERRQDQPLVCGESQLLEGTTMSWLGGCRCDPSCCREGEICPGGAYSDSCCKPYTCGGLECGMRGWDSSYARGCYGQVDCGDCGPYGVCRMGGTCECDAQTCPSGCCMPGESCLAGGVCGIGPTIEPIVRSDARLDAIDAHGDSFAVSGFGSATMTLGALSLSEALDPLEGWGRFVARGATDGSLSWARGMPASQPVQVSVAPSGDVLAMGYFENPGAGVDVEIGRGATQTVLAPPFDFSLGQLLVARFTPDGEVVRITRVTFGNPDAVRMATLPDGGFAVALHQVAGAATLAPGTPDETTVGGPSFSGVVVARFAPDATLLWAQPIGSDDGGCTLIGLAVTSTGAVTVSSNASGTVEIGAGTSAMTAGSAYETHALLVQLSTDGAPAWSCETGGGAGTVASGPGGSVTFSHYSASWPEVMGPSLDCRTAGGTVSSRPTVSGAQYELAQVGSSGDIQRIMAVGAVSLIASDPAGRLLTEQHGVIDLGTGGSYSTYSPTVVARDPDWRFVAARELGAYRPSAMVAPSSGLALLLGSEIVNSESSPILVRIAF